MIDSVKPIPQEDTMKFPYVTAQVIAASDAITNHQAKLTAEIATLDSQIMALMLQKHLLESVRRFNEFRLISLANAAIAIQDAPEEVLALRRHWKALSKASARDDIKVSVARRRIEEAKTTLQQLRFKCPHPFIIQRDGMSGDYDGNGTTPAKRTCMTCGTEEYEWTRGGTRKDFSTLALSPKRLGMRFIGSLSGMKTYEDFVEAALASDDPRELLFDERKMEQLRESYEAARASKTPG